MGYNKYSIRVRRANGRMKGKVKFSYVDYMNKRHNVTIKPNQAITVKVNGSLPPIVRSMERRGILEIIEIGTPKIIQPKQRNSDIPNKALNIPDDYSLGIYIVNLNNSGYTESLLRCLSEQVNRRFSVTLRDQDSDETGTKDLLDWAETLEFVDCVDRGTENRPLNYLWNEYASNTEHRLVCFLNNDIEVCKFFVDDTIMALSDPEVGIAIHPTNRLDFKDTKNIQDIQYLASPKYQGWDFSFRKDNYVPIPEQLKIFGGDNWVFSSICGKNGKRVAVCKSSPIIHYKERTRVKTEGIEKIHNQDKRAWATLVSEGDAVNIPPTIGEVSNKVPPPGMLLNSNRKCVFTAIIGNYQDLPKIDTAKNKGWDFICFSDSDIKPTAPWRIVRIPKVEGSGRELTLKARLIKLGYYRNLNMYDDLVWIDARVQPLKDFDGLIKKRAGNDIVFSSNPSGDFKTEVLRIKEAGVEKASILDSVVDKYSISGIDTSKPTIASGIMCFRNNNRVEEFFRLWSDATKNGTVRDQISVYYAWDKSDIRYNTLSWEYTFRKFSKLRGRKVKRYAIDK